MSIFVRKEPFDERWEILAVFSNGQATTKPLQTFIKYPRVRPGKIIATVLGNKKEAQEIEEVVRGLDRCCTMSYESKEWGGASSKIYSDQVRVLNWTSPVSTLEDRPDTQIAEFELERLEVTHIYSPKGEERDIIFVLASPFTPWKLLPDKDSMKYGKIRYLDKKLELANNALYDIYVTELNYFEQDNENSRLLLETSEIGLRFQENDKSRKMSDEEFVSGAKAVVEDLLLLMSFLSRSWIVWYQYSLRTPSTSITNIRQVFRQINEKEPYISDLIVEPSKIDEFISRALYEMQNLRENGLGLEVVINTMLVTYEAKYIDGKFLTLFTALEKLINYYSELNGMQEILSKNIFSKINKEIRKNVKKEIEDVNIRKQIYAKLLELNRYPLMFLLEKMYDELNTGLADLYKPNEPITLIQTRNSLVHSGKRPKPGVISKDYHRLRALVERVVLRLLKWDDLSNCPKPNIKKWLVGN